MIHSPNSVIIDFSALEHNLDQVKKLTNPKTSVMGVVKSDAYGHGLVPVSKLLERKGVDYLGVAHLHEAVELRKNGIRLPIVILCGIRSREEALEVVDKDLTPVLYDLRIARVLDEESARRDKKTSIHIKVDTGMGRLGIPYPEVGSFLKSIMKCKRLRLEGLCSHLSSADEAEYDFTEAQIDHFKEAIGMGRSMGVELPLNNLANSAGIMAHKASHFDLVRPGIMLYGGGPSPGFAAPLPLKPVMNFRGQIIQIRELPGNTPVSYGRTYHTKGPEKVAVLSAGYGDGLPRSISNRGKVLIKGIKTDIIGRVCMNMIMANVTGLEDIGVGDEAVFLGSQAGESITGDDMARWAGTIAYEIFCSIGSGNTREYRE